jgi:GH18 family chitinase
LGISGYRRVWDSAGGVPYAYSKSMWFSYEDTQSAAGKVWNEYFDVTF